LLILAAALSIFTNSLKMHLLKLHIISIRFTMRTNLFIVYPVFLIILVFILLLILRYLVLSTLLALGYLLLVFFGGFATEIFVFGYFAGFNMKRS